MAAPTKAELLELIECQKDTIAIQAKTIVSQQGEMTNAVEQITQICEGMKAIAENNSQTRAMVEEVKEEIKAAGEREYPIVPGFWN